MKIDIQNLLKLAGEATPGPWYVAGPPWLPNDVETYVLCDSPDPHAGTMIFDMPSADMAGVEDRYDDDEWRGRNDANAAYAAACSPEVIKALCEAGRALALTTNALANFLENSDFQVMVGGNPVVVDGMLATSRFALERGRKALEPFTEE
jgi:hypothetical protein